MLPPGASNYGGPHLRWATSSTTCKKGKLVVFELDKEKETELGDVAGYRVSADGTKMLVRTGGDFAIVDLPTGQAGLGDKKLSLADLKITLDRHAEWNQIYAECWRQMRDFFYARTCTASTGPAMRKRYEPLLAHVRTGPTSPT